MGRKGKTGIPRGFVVGSDSVAMMGAVVFRSEAQPGESMVEAGSRGRAGRFGVGNR